MYPIQLCSLIVDIDTKRVDVAGNSDLYYFGHFNAQDDTQEKKEKKK
jgi:hypothetical protein